jgi:AraC-like DNA-binding protein
MKVAPRIVSATVITPIVAEAKRLGIDCAHVLSDPAVLDDLDGFVTVAEQGALWRHLADNVPPAFGLSAGANFARGTFRALEYLVRTSPTLEAGLHQLARHHGVLSGRADIVAVPCTDGLRIVIVGPHDHEPYTAHVEDFSVAAILHLARDATGVELTPQSVSLRQPRPEDDEDHRAFFSNTASFAQTETSIVFGHAVLRRAMKEADPTLTAIMADCVAKQIDSLPTAPTSVADAVRRILSEDLLANMAVADAAKSLAMSPRTLQRRLSDEDTTFQELLDSVRHQLATQYLGKPELNIVDVALLLGYADGDSLSRAYKRWTGMTAAEARRPAQS